MNAVQAARHNARDGGLAGAALAGKDVAVRDAILRDRVFERGLDVLLIDHVLKRLGAVFARYDLIHGVAGVRMKHGPVCQAPGNPRHTNRTTTVASFRTWRGLQPSVARSPRPDKKLSYHAMFLGLNARSGAA